MLTVDPMDAGEEAPYGWGLFDCPDPHHEAVEVQGFDDEGTPDTYAWWRIWNLALMGDPASRTALSMLRSDCPSEFDLIVMFNLAAGDYEVDPPPYREES